MAMTFRKLTAPEPAAAYLAETISARITKGKKVLWLISGGSAIAVATAASKLLVGLPLEHLTVSLTDERYGPVDHHDSNWRQLMHAGFELKGAHMHPVLTGKDMQTTTEEFAAFLEQQLANTDYALGFLGIGPDGHTSGILPGSEATRASALVYGYEWTDYQRITTTAPAIAKLNEAVVYAVGEAKWPTLDNLQTEVPADEQPAQLLKAVPKLTIFNDHIGEKV